MTAFKSHHRRSLGVLITSSLMIFNSGADAVEDKWDFFFRHSDSKPMSSIFYDVTVESRLPLAGKPFSWRVEIKMKHARSDGLSSQEEFEVLNKLEDQIEAEGLKYGLSYVGRITGDGVRDLRFLGPPPSAETSPKIVEVARRLGYQVQVMTNFDPDARSYTEYLLPNSDEKDEIENQKVIAQLQQNGDKLIAARPVDHWLYFPSEAARNNFERAATSQNFRIVDKQRVTTAENSFSIHLQRTAVPTWNNMNHETALLRKMASAYQGNYDGWETSVEK